MLPNSDRTIFPCVVGQFLLAFALRIFGSPAIAIDSPRTINIRGNILDIMNLLVSCICLLSPFVESYFSGAASVLTTDATTIYIRDCAFVGAFLNIGEVTGLVTGCRFTGNNIFNDCTGLTICNNYFNRISGYSITLYNTSGFAGTGRATVCDNVYVGSDLFFIRGFIYE